MEASIPGTKLDEPANSTMASATESRDLRTGATVWEAYGTDAVQGRAFNQSRKADLVVVGAGITGALIAEAATDIGLQTVVLDRRQPAHGSTAASTALLQFEIDTPLVRLVDEVGFRTGEPGVAALAAGCRRLAHPCREAGNSLCLQAARGFLFGG